MILSVNRWIWLAPPVFLAHDAEEIVTAVPWLRAHATELPAILLPYSMGVTTGGLAVSVLVLLAGVLLAAWSGEHRVRRRERPWLFLVVAGALAANALTHVGQAVYFRAYTPGVVTAVLLVAPYVLGLARALSSAGLATPRQLVWSLGLGAVVQVPLALAGLAAGGNLGGAAP